MLCNAAVISYLTYLKNVTVSMSRGHITGFAVRYRTCPVSDGLWQISLGNIGVDQVSMELGRAAVRVWPDEPFTSRTVPSASLL
jgi:hypothetical protein